MGDDEARRIADHMASADRSVAMSERDIGSERVRHALTAIHHDLQAMVIALVAIAGPVE